MTVLVPRTRTIGVRLSEEEFAALERYCLDTGARSLSDIARNAICGFLAQPKQESVLISTVSENAAQLKELEQKLVEITAEIALLKSGDRRPGERKNLEPGSSD